MYPELISFLAVENDTVLDNTDDRKQTMLKDKLASPPIKVEAVPGEASSTGKTLFKGKGRGAALMKKTNKDTKSQKKAIKEAFIDPGSKRKTSERQRMMKVSIYSTSTLGH